MARKKRRRWLPRPVSILLAFLLFGGLGWAGVYAYDRGFSSKWRRLVQEEFRKRGIEFDFKRLTIDPIEGVVAREVRIFEGPERETVLAAISSVTVDLDLARALSKTFELRSVDLENAELSLPIDPTDENSEVLRVRDLSARVRFVDGRIDIGNVAGDLHGLRFRIRGDLQLPGKNQEQSKTMEERLAEIQVRRSLMAAWVRRIPEMRVTGPPPTLDVELYGSLARAKSLDGKLAFRCGGLEYEGFAFDHVEIDAETRDGGLELQRFLATTERGERLEASAAWDGEDGPVAFQIDSEMNLVELIRHVKPWPMLGEIVFFNDAPRLSVEGTLQLPEKAEAEEGNSADEPEGSGFRLKALGHLESGRFQSRGEVFQRGRVDFHVDGDRYYLRNGRVEHLSGDLRFQAMQNEEGFRLRASSSLDPTVATRFVATTGMRKVLEAFHFGKEPSVLLSFEATGPTSEPSSWHSVGHIDLRDFELKGVPFLHFDASFQSKNDVHWYRDVFVERPEGTASADLLEVDHRAYRVRFENLRGTLEPVAAVQPFNRNVSKHLSRYRWSETPSFVLNGVIDTRPEAIQTDLRCRFTSNGAASLPFLGKTLVLPQLAGDLHFLGRNVDLKLRGGLFEGTMVNHTRFEPGQRFTTRFSAENLSFQELADTYFGGSETQGRLKIDTTIGGLSNDPHSLRGVGELALTDGNLFSVPALGPLSKLLSSLLNDPRAGYSVATEARATFNYSDGVARTTDFEALTPGFQLNLTGDLDVLDDRLSLNAGVRLRGATGIFLNPVAATLLEFEGTGPSKQVEWRPKRLVRPLGGDAPGLRPEDR